MDRLSADRIIANALADDTFLMLTERLTGQNRDVSEKGKAHNYAPLLFSKEPDNQGIRKSEFEASMLRLLKKGRR